MDPNAAKPNIGRIYDYVLGGHHNLEVDRVAARRMIELLPSYPRWARLNRWFLQMVAERWSRAGHRNILDLASGMPTQDHFHTVAPNARVLYTDNDPITAAYSREVLGDNPSVAYVQADITEPAPILAAADRLFGGERQVAIGCIGIAYFIDDDRLARLMRALHDWAAPGSVMALSFIYTGGTTENLTKLVEMSKPMGIDFYPRDEAEMRRIAAPWQFQEVKTLASWLAVENLLQEADREGVNAEMYGALLEHKGQGG
jgi:hypothetical protein